MSGVCIPLSGAPPNLTGQTVKVLKVRLNRSKGFSKTRLVHGITRHFFEFGPFRLDAERHRLLCDGEVVPLSTKATEALFVLVRRAVQKIVHRMEL